MNSAEDFLRRIAEDKRAEISRLRSQISGSEIRRRAAAAPSPRDFAGALKNAAARGQYPVIAEIKKKSPSKGILRAEFTPAALAAEYESGGAACLSVLTDAPYFGGGGGDLRAARESCALPVLRKDFMLEEWQIYESRALGADAVLLIAALLPPEKTAQMAKTAESLGMAALAETHDETELRAALAVPNVLIGINNRSLNDFRVSLQTAEKLLPLAGGRFAVAESGIQSAADIARLSAAGANGFLIGETLMRADSPAEKLRELFGNPKY